MATTHATPLQPRPPSEGVNSFVRNASVPQPYLAYREYLQHYEPNVFALLLNPDGDFAGEYRLAQQIARLLGEPGLTFPGESRPMYKDCVWAEVYRRQ